MPDMLICIILMYERRIVLTLISKQQKHIFYLFLMLKGLQAYISGMQVGAAQPHVYPKDLMRLTVLIAPEALCRRFEPLVTPIFNLIKTLKYQNQKLAQARDLLLPRRMSGKIEV